MRKKLTDESATLVQRLYTCINFCLYKKFICTSLGTKGIRPTVWAQLNKWGFHTIIFISNSTFFISRVSGWKWKKNETYDSTDILATPRTCLTLLKICFGPLEVGVRLIGSTYFCGLKVTFGLKNLGTSEVLLSVQLSFSLLISTNPIYTQHCDDIFLNHWVGNLVPLF